MKREERFKRAEEIMSLLDVINNLDYAYSENENEYFENSVMRLTRVKPLLWSNKDANRQQCYSNMFSKILLAYLISELKEKNIFDGGFLEEIKDMEIDIFEEFFYDDCGYKTSAVLEKFIQRSITDQGFFKNYTEYVDITNVIETDDITLIKKEMNRAIIKNFPKLEPYIILDEVELIFWNLAYYLDPFFDIEIELEIIESSILYEIMEKESGCPTDIGEDIINSSKEIFSVILQSDYLYDELRWEIVDKEERKIYFCAVTCSDVYGDDLFYPQFATDRLHRYNYRNMFLILDLQKKIGEYQRLYLNN